MPKRIEIPGKGILEFPDGMAEEQMREAIHRNFPDLGPPPQEPKMLQEGEGLVKTLGLVKDMAVDSAKDIGYSLGVTKGSPGFMGHTREGFQGKSPEPGPLSIRKLNPFLSAAREYGGETGKRVSDTAAGVIHDVSNLDALLAPVIAGGRRLVMRSPGAAGFLQEEAASTLRKIPTDKIKGPQAKNLWDMFNQAGTNEIYAPNTLFAINRAKQELMKSANPPEEILRHLTNIEDRISRGGGRIALELLDADRKSIGDLIRKTQKTGGTKNFAADSIYEGIYKDLEATASAGGPSAFGADLNIAAAKASKKEFARQDFSDLIERSIQTREKDQSTWVNFKQLKNHFKTDKGKSLLSKLDPAERADIMDTIEALSRETSSLPPAGAYGSGRHIENAAVLTALGHLFGVDPGSLLQTAATGYGMSALLSWALMTAAGRNALRSLSNPKITTALGTATKIGMGSQAAKGAEEAYPDLKRVLIGE